MDKLTPERRSENMRAIRSEGMKPERVVRSVAHRLGFRFRLHRRDLPGKPDLVFPRLRKIIFVHGCFWHQHPNAKCNDARLPKSNRAYWIPKLRRNAERDALNIKILRSGGWKILVVWECETKRIEQLTTRIERFLLK